MNIQKIVENNIVNLVFKIKFNILAKLYYLFCLFTVADIIL